MDDPRFIVEVVLQRPKGDIHGVSNGPVFRSVMTTIADEIVAPRRAVGEGGHELGIGFAGTGDSSGAPLEATALAGKRSLRLTAVLKLMQPA